MIKTIPFSTKKISPNSSQTTREELVWTFIEKKFNVKPKILLLCFVPKSHVLNTMLSFSKGISDILVEESFSSSSFPPGVGLLLSRSQALFSKKKRD